MNPEKDLVFLSKKLLASTKIKKTSLGKVKVIPKEALNAQEKLAGQTALVTGGCGFIGSELTAQLSQIAANVVVVDNLSNGKERNIAELLEANVTFVASDIRDTAEMRRLMKDVDVVFHLACLGVRHSIHSPKENNEVNATATLDLLALAREENIKRFVHVSSSEIYGTATRTPMDEETPAFPHTIYGSSKLAGECHARAYAKTYGFPTVVLRPFNSFGPRCHHEGDSGEVIPKFILRTLAEQPMLIFGDGMQTRDFCHVEDTARGILMSGSCDAAIGQTINLGAGKETSINDLANLIVEVTGSTNAKIEHCPPRPGDILRLYADSSLAERLLGFRPKIDLRTGLKKLLEWYTSQDLQPKELLQEDRPFNWLQGDLNK
jgi:UDP-glucose 4-epimerase